MPVVRLCCGFLVFFEGDNFENCPIFLRYKNALCAGLAVVLRRFSGGLVVLSGRFSGGLAPVWWWLLKCRCRSRALFGFLRETPVSH